jgi:hypothetical protein
MAPIIELISWHNREMRKWLLVVSALALVCSPRITAWGLTGHVVISRAAINALPPDVPPFVKRQIDWIATRSITPDSYRAASEPFIKMAEDPSHEWHLEQIAFLKTIPRSRLEFIQALYDEYKRLEKSDPAKAALANPTSTGMLPYTTMEVYERLKVTFRTWREQQRDKQPTSFTEQDAAFYIGWLSHYVADASQPLHSSIQHDGWRGDNPRNYTRDGAVHWGFENDFVDLIGLKEGDLQGRVAAAKTVVDPFSAILAHLARSNTRVEQVYALEQQHALADKSNAPARELVYLCTSDGVTLLRDLIYTAWTTSAAPAAARTGIVQPNDPKNPRYNPATGTAPADVPK